MNGALASLVHGGLASTMQVVVIRCLIRHLYRAVEMLAWGGDAWAGYLIR